MRIVTVAGTRPQFIKAATLSREIRKLDDEYFIARDSEALLPHMFFDSFEAPEPDYKLHVSPGTACEMIAEIMETMEDLIEDVDPDVVLTFGDSDSTVAAALAAVKSGYLVAHIDAGLRIHRRDMPEEKNRIITDHVSDLLFCPTSTCVNNLTREGIVKNVFLPGDLMLDALLYTSKVSLQRSTVLENLRLTEKEYVVLAIHHHLAIGNPARLNSILSAIKKSGLITVLSMDLKTSEAIRFAGLQDRVKEIPNIVAIGELSYSDFVRLMIGSKKILTDSSVIQREAYILKVPCITLREETEWPETVQDGWNILVGADEEKILNAITSFEPTGMQKSDFGEGKTAIKMARVLHEGLGEILKESKSLS